MSGISGLDPGVPSDHLQALIALVDPSGWPGIPTIPPVVRQQAGCCLFFRGLSLIENVDIIVSAHTPA